MPRGARHGDAKARLALASRIEAHRRLAAGATTCSLASSQPPATDSTRRLTKGSLAPLCEVVMLPAARGCDAHPKTCSTSGGAPTRPSLGSPRRPPGRRLSEEITSPLLISGPRTRRDSLRQELTRPVLDQPSIRVLHSLDSIRRRVQRRSRVLPSAAVKPAHGPESGFQAAVVCLDGLLVYCSVTDRRRAATHRAPADRRASGVWTVGLGDLLLRSCVRAEWCSRPLWGLPQSSHWLPDHRCSFSRDSVSPWIA